MKNLLKSAALLTALVLLAGCGGNSADMSNPESIAKTAIEMAEKSVPEAESPELGVLPSLFLQRKAANDSVKSMRSRAQDEIEIKNKTDVEEGLRQAIVISESADRAKKIIDSRYEEKINEISAKLIGKSIKADVDKSQYKAARVVITKVEDSGLVVMEASLTLSEPLAGNLSDLKYISWEWQKANGEVIEKGSTTVHPVTDGLKNEAGGVIQVKITVYARSMGEMTAVRFIRQD